MQKQKDDLANSQADAQGIEQTVPEGQATTTVGATTVIKKPELSKGRGRKAPRFRDNRHGQQRGVRKLQPLKRPEKETPR
jgi:hypothetical protein